MASSDPSSIVPADPSGASSVEKAFALLQAVVAAGQATGVRELARRTGIARSTAARLLANLESLGMVERAADGVVPGPGLATLTPGADLGHLGLAERFRPLLADLVRRFGESAALTVDDGNAAMYVDQLPGPGAVQVPDATGRSYPFHVVAPGLILMTNWEPNRLATYLAGPLAAPTALSMVSADALRARVVTIGVLGVAWTDQELDLEVNGVAVPVRDRQGGVVASISLYGPAYRLNPRLCSGLGLELAAHVGARTPAVFGL